MPEQHRYLANKCEDIVNLQGAEAYCVATRTASYYYYAIKGVGLFACAPRQLLCLKFVDV